MDTEFDDDPEGDMLVVSLGVEVPVGLLVPKRENVCELEIVMVPPFTLPRGERDTVIVRVEERFVVGVALATVRDALGERVEDKDTEGDWEPDGDTEVDPEEEGEPLGELLEEELYAPDTLGELDIEAERVAWTLLEPVLLRVFLPDKLRVGERGPDFVKEGDFEMDGEGEDEAVGLKDMDAEEEEEVDRESDRLPESVINTEKLEDWETEGLPLPLTLPLFAELFVLDTVPLLDPVTVLL